MLHLGTRRSGWNRDRLIALVKKMCETRLSELERGDELPQSIAKAMAVTTLSMNLTPGIRKQNFADFYQFRPDIVTLQNNIAKAIWLINEKVRVSELKELQILLGLNTDLPIKGLRSAIRNLLTEYLFECDDMDVIPRSLLDTLSVINRSSRTVPLRYFPKEEIDEDVECILGVSAQAKQVILDLLPDHDYYQDFTDAYMEDLEESESDESDTDMALLFESYESPNKSFMIESNETVESIGDSLFTEKNVSDIDHAILGSNISTDTDDVSKHTGAAPGFSGANLKPKNTGAVDIDGEFDDSDQSGSRSKYLCVQDACDETSLVAYKLIGHILKECARIEGLDLDPADISYLTAGHAKTDHPPGAPEKPSSMDDDVGVFDQSWRR
uniref:Uncharacterized protein n=1 Tax=Kalanchoe fedtschenkoi TaxID=63787 RepID=A0A7N0TX02_KALFE